MKKIMVLLMVMVGFAGCSLLKEQMPKDPLTVSLGKERGDPEIACSNILAYVKRGLLEEMELPEHYTQDEVEFAFDTV